MGRDSILASCFDRIFESKLSNEVSRSESYRQAADEFQREFKVNAYSDWDSYRQSRAHRRKRKRSHE